MELKHYINNREIDEPVGFDSFKMVMKRGEYHGMSAEVSEQTLEFYGKAADMIHEAYNTDIDTELRYIVMSDGTEVYNGVIDLSTYEEQRSQYYSVSCKVGEVGVKTTFNNRVDTVVNLNNDKTIDGKNLVGYSGSWKRLIIPKKHIGYSNEMSNDKDDSFALSKPKYAGEWDNMANIWFLQSDVNEFGTLNEDGCIFKKSEDHNDKYGANTTCDIMLNLTLRIDSFNFIAYGQGGYVDGRIVLFADNTAILTGSTVRFGKGSIIRLVETISSVPIANEFRLVVQGYRNIDMNWYTDNAFSVVSDSRVRMKMYDNLQTLTPPVQMLMVGDALQKIALCCSENELVLRSDWYNSTLLPVGSAPKEYGGAAKAITNGYKIRGLFADSEHERPMTTSFKEMIESLDAMDCIGWGIVEEDGNLHLRVERWDWFYNSNKILSAYAPNEIKRTVDESRIVTELNIGYNKYATADAYNSIDSVHGERTFVSPIKAVHSSIKRLSAFIADNYAIEETRRAQFQVDASEEFKYDENIFVFELAKTRVGRLGAYNIRSAAEDVSGIDRPAEFINAKLSPRRCAERWKDYLFAVNGAKAMKFSTGKLNTSAQYSTNNNTSLWSVTTDSTAENSEIESTPCIFKAETLSFKYPLTISQYKAIKANPYGLIEVDGIQGWIKEFSYTFNTGEAEFKLIPKA